MAIKAKASPQLFKEVADKASEILNDEISKGLAYLGEQCVKRIREDRTNWQDQTGNLRSSIGYAVCNYGRTLFESQFESVTGKTGTGTSGSQTGKNYVETLAKQYADVYTLVVVAGMDYSEYLELKGYDVLQGTEVWAKAEIDKVINVYYRRAERRIQDLINKMLR